jgi:hypothetical protein
MEKPRGYWGFAILGSFGGLTCDFAEDFCMKIVGDSKGKADRASARLPTLATMKPSRRWGTRIRGEMVGHV